MLKKILITGGCGFLGQYITRDLLNEFSEIEIKIVDLKSNPNPVFNFDNHPNLKISLDRDICFYDVIEDEFRNVDLVIHLAGLVSYSIKDKELMEAVNVQGTRNVLKAASQHNVKHLIHVSSSAALGFYDNTHGFIDENFSFDWNIAKKRKKFYMLSKHSADEEVKKYFNDGHKGVIIFPSAMFGPGDYTNSSRIIRAMNNGKILFNMPGGYCIIDVRDVSRGILAILKKGIPEGNFLLSGYNLTYKEINGIIADELSVNNPKLTIPRALRSPIYYLAYTIESISKNRPELTADNIDSSFKFRYFDNSKAKSELGWEPNISFRQTVKDSINWMTMNGFLRK